MFAVGQIHAQRADSTRPHNRFDSTNLQSVEVRGHKRPDIATDPHSTLTGRQLLQVAGNTLGETVKNIPGLNSLQTGPGISKPVIHGLHSNRVLILNNGVRQEGQQWGSEHAPEIDPFVAQSITVIKGAASVRYGSDAIVGVLLVEPSTLAPQKPLQGEASLVSGSNGRLGALSGMLEGRIDTGWFKGFNWRAQGTLKEAGNFRTARYYLANTGIREGDFSLTTNYASRNNRFGAEVYYSQFHNKIGIFAGSHVGNVSDLYAAFARSKPITPSYFTYLIARTYQQITHKLLKLDAHYLLKNGDRIEAQFADQRNRRDEYDVDLPYSTDPAILAMPQISFRIKTQSLDLIYHRAARNHVTADYGISGGTQGNVFNGIRYLVPNFRNYSGGVFGIERYAKGPWMVEAGLRYDYRWLRVYRINNTNLATYHNIATWSNVTGTVGASYRVNERLSFTANVGSAWRPPSVNELYIDGIHLSAASYEKGDSSLKSERSYNLTFSGKYEAPGFYAELVAYYNRINDFIYAKPSLTPITLISGTYPLFNYTQANVTLKGFDLDIHYDILRRLRFESKTSVVRGWNRSINDWLIFMPADRFDNSLRYDFGTWGRTRGWYLSGGLLGVVRQTRVPPNSDYVPPPDGYVLVNANAGFECPWGRKTVHIELAGTNLANRPYRDYLNRFRYYADDLGINLVLRGRINF